MNRRSFLKLATTAAAGIAVARRALPAVPRTREPTMRHRPIPHGGEEIPVVGLGTSRTFDVGTSESERAPLAEVLRLFFAAGGSVIDTSPMYGRAETVVGDLVSAGKYPAFLATKVWTTGREKGTAQMNESMRLLRTRRIDLMQIHNLLDWRAHLPTLRSWRDEGRIRYLGITHYSLSTFDEMERILRSEKLDFVQLPYSVTVRRAEDRLLPAAAQTGAAVLVMRPFGEGDLFSRVRGRPVPPWATERGFGSWAQLFLAFILAHPAVTCAIPATANPKHLSENVAAGSGPELDAELRKKLIAEVAP